MNNRRVCSAQVNYLIQSVYSELAPLSGSYTPRGSFIPLHLSPRARYQATRDSLYAPEPAEMMQTSQF